MDFGELALLLELLVHVIEEDPLPFSVVVTGVVPELVITINRVRFLLQLVAFVLVAAQNKIPGRVDFLSFRVDHCLIIDTAYHVEIYFDWPD